MAILTNVYFWIIAFFVAVVLLIIMFIVLILIKMKTHAFIELKASFKKMPVSIFTSDGNYLDMRADPVDAGLIVDPDYGVFIRNEKNSYLGKSTRNIYDLYDTAFAPGISLKACQSAQVIKDLLQEDNDFYELQSAISDGTLKDESIDCIRSNVNTSHLKQLFNCIEPHNIHASVEKKVAKQIHSMGKGANLQMLWVFIIGLAGVVCGFILLKMFNV